MKGGQYVNTKGEGGVGSLLDKVGRLKTVCCLGRCQSHLELGVQAEQEIELLQPQANIERIEGYF